MAGSPQEQIDFLKCEFMAHLKRCGIKSLVQRKLAAHVLLDGVDAEINGEPVKSLTGFTTRQLAAELKCSPSTLHEAAAMLNRKPWFKTLDPTGENPSVTYVLYHVTARSLEPPDPLAQLRIGEVRAMQEEETVRPALGSVRVCSAPFGSVREAPCSESYPITKSVSFNTQNQHGAEQRPNAPEQRRSLPRRTLPAMPWKVGAVTDDELKAAYRQQDLELPRLMYEHAAHMQWLARSPDTWLRFLTGWHHCATCPGLKSRVGVLVMFTKKGLDVSRMRQASEDWAAKMIRHEHSDPALVALGRSMAPEEVF